MTLNDALDIWQVHYPGMWENETGPEDWFAVSNDEGIVAYLTTEADAFRYRMWEVNRTLNP